ncbi:hypothetical protein [Bradyrhizobium sp. 33ap4]|uniref:hypothetical protein n=1 Tax=Bradyrhizobium sp. 33ap4 TaxID=3061630 RepID=UPI002931A063|nr:hypothetical protein [Bradyrhizobium sp. 33ap4]
MTWQDYESDLELRLKDLHGRVHRGAYRPQPSRRTYIPKADGKQRPLAIAALEDKIVQGATVLVLNAIYERDFVFSPDEDRMFSTAVKLSKVNWILDADIRNCLDVASYYTFVFLRGPKRSGATAGIEFVCLLPVRDRRKRPQARRALHVARWFAARRRVVHGLERLPVTFERALHKARPQLVIDTDALRRARCDLLSGNEAVVEAAMQSIGCDPESICCSLDRHALAVLHLLFRL